MFAYFKKGMKARKAGLSRTANPYNFRCEKGHEWDSGWLMLLEKYPKLIAKHLDKLLVKE